MNHILPYDAINEAAALPVMPAFLKSAGAKPDHVQYAGPRNVGNPPNNAWVLSIPSIVDKKTWSLEFFPDGTFSTSASGASFLRSGGKWKADASSSFRIGGKTLKGVAMTFTTFLVSNPPS